MRLLTSHLALTRENFAVDLDQCRANIAAYLNRVIDGETIRQVDLANAARCSEQAVSKWKKTGMVNLSSLIAISETTGDPIDVILGRAPVSPVSEFTPEELQMARRVVQEARALYQHQETPPCSSEKKKP